MLRILHLIRLISFGTCLASARSHSGGNNTQSFSKTLVPLRYPQEKAFNFHTFMCALVDPVLRTPLWGSTPHRMTQRNFVGTNRRKKAFAPFSIL